VCLGRKAIWDKGLREIGNKFHDLSDEFGVTKGQVGQDVLKTFAWALCVLEIYGVICVDYGVWGTTGDPFGKLGGGGRILPRQNFTYPLPISYILIMVVIPTDLLKGKQNE